MCIRDSHIDELNPKKIYEDVKDGLTGKKNREAVSYTHLPDSSQFAETL